ncbi:hypothetical protein [Micromonospora pattaloongensis]|uniref:hypothetical protein n=1 Tax=Micromonospora pattaloongensis TaxID=405436 RepID=UPI0015872760|nr:hypothetical protein [Micromonospora pattaloongensis]
MVGRGGGAYDDRTANAITVNVPDARTGFNSLGLPPLTVQSWNASAGVPPRGYTPGGSD